MRDIMASCVGEHAIQLVSDASCSSISTNSATQSSVSSVYRIIPTSKLNHHLIITVTWNKTAATFTFGPDDDPSSVISIELNPNSSTSTRLFRSKNKYKGNRAFQFHDSEINIFYDLSSAKYDIHDSHLGPEPVSRFYVLIMVDSELCLKLGDMSEEAAVSRKMKSFVSRVAKCCLISRRVYFSGNSDYVRVTKVKLSENGNPHEVSIRFNKEKIGLRSPTMSIWIDKKNVIRVKRLQWNFRGNQTFFIDGLVVDLMWDVHGWLFDHHVHGRRENSAGAGGVVMFRTSSSTVESRRPWLGDDLMDKRQDEFSLVIHVANG